MIKIFTGNDRIRAKQEIEKNLGKNYEVIEGINLTPNDLPSIFKGSSLFATSRNILIRDLSSNKSVFDRLPDYLDTPHKIIIQELKLDKRSSTYRSIKNSIEIREFNLPENPNYHIVFDIFKTAKQNGKKSILMLEQIKSNEDPIMFFGLLASQALKEYQSRQGTKEKRILKELARLDLNLKSSPIDSWLLIESFLLKLETINKK